MTVDTEAITARLANYHAHKGDPYAYYEGEIEAVRELRRCAPGDIAALLAEVARLQKELLETRVAFWCAVSSVGGAVRIPPRIASERPENMEVSRWDDPATGEAVYRAALQAVEETGDV